MSQHKLTSHDPNNILLFINYKVKIPSGPVILHILYILWICCYSVVTLDDFSLISSGTFRNLGVAFDQDLSFECHIKQISRSAFFHSCYIAKIWYFLSQNEVEKLIHSRLDYCNSLLSDCPIKSLKTSAYSQRCSLCTHWHMKEWSYFSCFSFSALSSSEIQNRVWTPPLNVLIFLC